MQGNLTLSGDQSLLANGVWSMDCANCANCASKGDLVCGVIIDRSA